jgi:hypothetical protein
MNKFIAQLDFTFRIDLFVADVFSSELLHVFAALLAITLDPAIRSPVHAF